MAHRCLTTCCTDLICEVDIFLLRPCHCPRRLYYLYRTDLKSWASTEIKMSGLTSRDTGSSVCKRFRRAITRETRRGRNFYHGAARRSEILITGPFCETLPRQTRSGNTLGNIRTYVTRWNGMMISLRSAIAFGLIASNRIHFHI